MKDYRKLYDECVMELKRINMDISDKVVKVSVIGRLSRALGRCRATRSYEGNYWYEIEINPCMLSDEVEVKTAKNTIMHELIHTCPGCMNHGWEWKRRADRVNRMLGYNIQTQTEVGRLEAAGVTLKKTEYKYGVVCDKCGIIEKRKRWSDTLEHIGSYRCGSCRGHLHVISLDGNIQVLAANNHE